MGGFPAAHSQSQVPTPYCNRLSASCGWALACDSTATPACCRICALVSAAVSAAKSASWIRPREAARFSLTVCRLMIVDSKRFWIAPRLPRRPLTAVSAESTRAMAKFALETVSTPTPASVVVAEAVSATVVTPARPVVLPPTAASATATPASSVISCRKPLSLTKAETPSRFAWLIASAASWIVEPTLMSTVPIVAAAASVNVRTVGASVGSVSVSSASARAASPLVFPCVVRRIWLRPEP